MCKKIFDLLLVICILPFGPISGAQANSEALGTWEGLERGDEYETTWLMNVFNNLGGGRYSGTLEETYRSSEGICYNTYSTELNFQENSALLNIIHTVNSSNCDFTNSIFEFGNRFSYELTLDQNQMRSTRGQVSVALTKRSSGAPPTDEDTIDPGGESVGSLELTISDKCRDGYDSEYKIHGYSTSQPSPSTHVGTAPESGRVYGARDDGVEVTSRHACKVTTGEIVKSWCYGGSVRDGTDNYYGVGIKGDKACDECCTECPATGVATRRIAFGCGSASTADATSVEEGLGLTREDRRKIQLGLNALSWNAGAADGLFGNRTRAAIRSYQESENFEPSGYLTTGQAESLIAAGQAAAESVPTPTQPATGVSGSQAGYEFQDCADCPEMVVIPSGSFMMGSQRHNDEGPQHRVDIPSFALGKYEVTFAEYDACVDAGGCRHRPDDEGWGRDRRPVINVSWDDAKDYVSWLSERTGQRYRLASESEWEYAARAGTTTPYSFGHSISSDQANFGYNIDKTALVGSYPENSFGLHDMHGNVWEWVEDCWHSDYGGAPRGGSAWTSGGDCSERVLRGGSWDYGPGDLRSANRSGDVSGGRSGNVGFRVARTL